MSKVTRICSIAIMLLSTAGCDQLAKKVAKAELSSSEPISFLNGLIRLEYAENPGGFLSIGEDLPRSFFLSVSLLFAGLIILLLVLSIKNRDMDVAGLMGLSLMGGGVIGNLTDRLLNAGIVVDFMSVGVGPIRSGIFNFADVAILTGASVLLIQMWKEHRKTGAA